MIVICELNEVLVGTASGSKFPQGVWDLSFNEKTWNRLKSGVEKGVVTGIGIVSNEGGISTGHQCVESFEAKMNYVRWCIMEWTCISSISCTYCPDYGPLRLPNTGMIDSVMASLNCSVDQCLAIYFTDWMKEACDRLGMKSMPLHVFTNY